MTEHCTCCGRPLKESRIVWLELDQRINEYHDGIIPEESSQGAFPFGTDCARKAIVRANNALIKLKKGT